jgi:hypothetical protein
MSDPTNLARDAARAAGTEGEGAHQSSEARNARTIADLDFETPDEASMQFLEEQWRRFCKSIGLEGEVPDIRGVFAAEGTSPTLTGQQSRKLVRPFAALSRWLNGYPDLEER